MMASLFETNLNRSRLALDLWKQLVIIREITLSILAESNKTITGHNVCYCDMKGNVTVVIYDFSRAIITSRNR